MHLRPCLHGVGDPGLVGRFLLFCVLQSVKTKETNPTRPGFPTPCKQALSPLENGECNHRPQKLKKKNRDKCAVYLDL